MIGHCRRLRIPAQMAVIAFYFTVGILIESTPVDHTAQAVAMDEEYNIATIVLQNAVVNTLWMNMGYCKNKSMQAVLASFPKYHEDLIKLVFPFMPQRVGYKHLDVGIGYGDQALLFQTTFLSDYTGINISPEQIAIANQRFPTINARVMSATNLRFPRDTFDAVTSIESAFHYDTRERFVHEAFRVLKPGGMLIMLDVIFRPSELRRKLLDYPPFSDGVFRERWSSITSSAETVGHPLNPETNVTYKKLLEKVGYSIVDFRDISEDVVWWPNKRRLEFDKSLQGPHFLTNARFRAKGHVMEQLSNEIFLNTSRHMTKAHLDVEAGVSVSLDVFSPIMWADQMYVLIAARKP